MSKLHRHFRNLATAAVILVPFGAWVAPAQASTTDRLVSNVSHITHDVINFFGFGSDQANNPTDPQPVAERPAPELTPREIAPAPMADLAAPPRLPDAVAAA